MLNLISSLGAAWIVLGFVTFVLFGYFVPVATFRIMRNTGRIARQLERLNDSVENGRVNVTFTVTDKGGTGEALRHVAGAGAGPLKL